MVTEANIKTIRNDARCLAAIAADYGLRKEAIYKIKARKTANNATAFFTLNRVVLSVATGMGNLPLDYGTSWAGQSVEGQSAVPGGTYKLIRGCL